MSSKYFVVTEHIVPGQHIREYPNNVREDQEEVLHLHVKQYTPREAPDPSLPAVTILAAHGNGFPKESYEPVWDEILLRAKSQGFGIHNVWMADIAHEGSSYVLNENQLSDDPSWLDHSRDLLHITNHFRSQMKRPIVGIGHSMGGVQMVHLAHMHPRLLEGVVFLDPVVQPDRSGENIPVKPYNKWAYMSTYRRDIWPSRAEAAEGIRKAPMYAVWDDRAWEAFVKYGLRDLPTQVYPELPSGSSAADPPVTLTTPVNMEVHTFMRPNFKGVDANDNLVVDRKTHADVDISLGGPRPYPFYRPEAELGWKRLPSFRPKALFILGSTSFTMTSGCANAYKIIGTGVGGSGGQAEGKAHQVILDGIGHGLPHETPTKAAEVSAPWIGQLAKEWHRDEDEWRRARKALSVRDHVVPSDEWKNHFGPAPVRSKQGAPKPKI